VSSKEVKPRAVIHVDLDGARHIYAHHGWSFGGSGDPLFVSGMEGLLAFLEQNELTATLFAIGEYAADPDRLQWLERAVAAGHEIASHSQTHAEFDELDRVAKRRELEESKRGLEEALGVSVAGFRAPSYQIDRDTFELLADCGYRWDSSLRPEAAFEKRLQLPSLIDAPHRPLLDNPVMELPLPDHRPAPAPWHPSYAHLLGERYFQWGLERHRRRGLPLVLLFHLIDFAEPLAASELRGWKSRVYTLSGQSAEQKRARCQRMIERIKLGFEVIPTERLLAEAEARPARRLVLGVSTTHETGAALLAGHKTLAAVSEERFDRVKFSTKYPPKRAIRGAIETAGCDPRDITDVVIGGLPPGKLLGRLIKGQLADTFEFHGWNDYFPHLNKVVYRAFAFSRAIGYRRVLSFLKDEYGIAPRLHFVPHHLCHAASAYRTAPFEDALVVTADGVGDDTSITISEGRGGRLRLLELIPYPHSMGQFYTACTQLLGFRANRHEGKITGLSALGRVDPELKAKVKATIKKSGPGFRLDKRFYSEGIVRGLSFEQIRRGDDLFEALQYRNYKAPLKQLIAGHPRENVAAVFQTLLEEELLELVKPYMEQTGARNLCLAGGVFANVKANAALFRALGFEQVYIFPHMGDGGLAPGAALEFTQAEPEPFYDVYWGPEYSEGDMERALAAAADKGLRYRREEEIELSMAELLAAKKVVARFHGRMEFGPRALGHRSILYSASEREANTWLNQRLGRTEFMPFAPVALEEVAPRLFKDLAGTEHACRFMTIILDCTDWARENCSAVVHVDGTARPQLVNQQIDESTYRLLKYYEKLTGIPLLVNTSFNMHEEPIVCSPQDAVRAFLASKLDYLAMGPFLARVEEPVETEES
jgi:carbamoyltransferase